MVMLTNAPLFIVIRTLASCHPIKVRTDKEKNDEGR